MIMNTFLSSLMIVQYHFNTSYDFNIKIIKNSFEATIILPRVVVARNNESKQSDFVTHCSRGMQTLNEKR